MDACSGLEASAATAGSAVAESGASDVALEMQNRVSSLALEDSVPITVSLYYELEIHISTRATTV